MLMQKDQPVAFLSKVLGPMYQRLSIYEKEFFALIVAYGKMETIFAEVGIYHQNRPRKLVLSE